MFVSSTTLHKRNSSEGVMPSISSLSSGEIAINTHDGKFFTKTISNEIKTFLNSDQLPYTLDQSLSSVNFQHGGNTVSGVLSFVLGGVDNDVVGSGSTVVNGSDNDIDADYAFIGNGSENKILSNGDFGAILGGQNNTLEHSESFIIGSNITSHQSGFTYVNNLSTTGSYYGDGSKLTGIIAEGVVGPDTEVRSLTSNWQETYTFLQMNSSTLGTPPQLIKKHDFVDENNFSISFCGIALSGSSENSSVWNVTKIIYTEFGSVSSTQIATDVAWSDRLIINYN